MRKERTCLNEIVIYDPYINDMVVQFPHHEPERMLIPRKYFAGFFLDSVYYCHGGIETSGKILNSFISINLDTLLWKDVKVLKSQGDKKVFISPGGPPGFSNHCYGHKMTVITYKRKFVRLDALGEMDYGKASHYIKHEGVFMFGGVFGKNASEQRLNKKTYLFPLGVPSH
mmetsp:Transcript_28809/g.43493  ORF Transcript_28809/g.43493 Transcript_28809/m.43493 type:complete len:171 (+) Transcript_28809:145-657(+)